MDRFGHIIRAILAQSWAIDPNSLEWATILDVLEIRANGGTISDQEIEARLTAAAAQNGTRAGGRQVANVAIIPLYGTISPRMAMFARASGGTSAESILSDFRAAIENPKVDAIVFDVDSPGGVVTGIHELHGEILAARGVKPIVAVANHMAASAAYWPITACDEIVVTPSGQVGSIGIFTAHVDISEAQAMEGLKTTLIYAGKYKVEGNQFEPLGDDAKAAIQGQVVEIYDRMVGDIATARGIAVADVEASYGQGRTLLADKALAAGMVDRIDTLEATIERVGQQVLSPTTSGRRLAVTDRAQIAALAWGLPYSDRLALASALATDIADATRNRVALRAGEGRGLSSANRHGLEALAVSLRSAAGDVDEAVAAEPAPSTSPAKPARRAPVLELLEAASRGGYVLP